MSKTRSGQAGFQDQQLTCTYLVTPGVAPTLHARARFKLLIKLLFPTLGNPTKQEGEGGKRFHCGQPSPYTQKGPGALLDVEAYLQHRR